MRKLKLAVVGVGHLGRHHARILAGMDDVELVGIVDPFPTPRDDVAKTLNVPAYASCEPIVEGLDAAVIAAPTRFHHALATQLLERRIHTLVEKPITIDLDQADELVHLAARKHAVLQVGHVERFNPALRPVRAELRDPKYIDAVRHTGFSGRSTDIGVVLDLMIHDIDLTLSLVASPLRHVDAVGTSLFGPHEDVATAWLSFENGCVATLSASRASYEPARRMQVWTDAGYASVDFATRKTTFVRPCEAIASKRFDFNALSPDQRLHVKDKLFDEYLVKSEVEVEPADALTAELRDFIDSIRQSRPPRVTGAHGRDALRVAHAVVEKIASHRWSFGADPQTQEAPKPASVVPAPHFSRAPAWPGHPLRRAG